MHHSQHNLLSLLPLLPVICLEMRAADMLGIRHQLQRIVAQVRELWCRRFGTGILIAHRQGVRV